ncbi:leucine-rich repeat receptor protein kinase EMS1 [Tanacetum coccineum]
MDATFQAILAAIASFFIITLIFGFIYFMCKTKKETRPDIESRRRTRGIRSGTSLNTATSYSITESQLFDQSLNQIEMVDLVNATRNFSPDLIVGDGSFGLVYKAKLNNGVTVAVKKLDPDAFQGYREFRAEMETLGKIKHENIVKFYGYCAAGSERILIYEFIEKGSLDQWLYPTSSSSNNDNDHVMWAPPTPHTVLLEDIRNKYYHRDIKASNVLLDKDFEAHIADFGLARRIEDAHSHVSTQVAGTMGYMPPEYFYGATLATVMGDVYSFGILMFEIATSRRPNWPLKDEDQERKEIRLVEWAARMVSQNREMEMMDVGMSKEDLKENEVQEFFKIATFCTTEAPKLRPNMSEVVKLLNQIQGDTAV